MSLSDCHDLLIELRNQNLSYKQIAERLGYKRDTIKHYCQKNGLGGNRAGNTHDEREQSFKESFENKYSDFEYISGYERWSSLIKCKCRTCGQIQEKSAQCIKAGKDNIKCDNCVQLKSLRIRLVNLLARRHNGIIREQNKVIRESELEQQRIEKEERLKDNVCEECGKVFDAVSINQKYCSIKCLNKRHNRHKEIIRREKLKKNGKINWNISLDKLIKRDKNICHICGSKCDKSDYIIDENNNFIVGKNYPSIDHVVPVSKGGTHTWSNVKLAHHYCNTIKSNNEAYEEGTEQLKMIV